MFKGTCLRPGNNAQDGFPITWAVFCNMALSKVHLEIEITSSEWEQNAPFIFDMANCGWASSDVR